MRKGIENMLNDERYTVLSNLDKFMQGQLSERVGIAMRDVAVNIVDPNTDATAKRRIKIEISIKPNEDRTTASLAVSVRTALAASEPVGTSVTVGVNQDGEYVIAERTKQNPGQMNIFGDEAKPKIMLLNTEEQEEGYGK